MSELTELYQQLILDHNARPRNFGDMSSCSHRAEGVNPLCGDHIIVQLLIQDNVIQDIRFSGSGCAICKSPASLMTEYLKGKSTELAQQAFSQFRALLAGDILDVDMDALGKLAAFSGVREFPMRVKCATLAWHTLHAALEKQSEAVSTEQDHG